MSKGSIKIRDVDKGWRRINSSLKALSGKEIAVGLQAGKTTKDGKMDMARLGAIHEFGADIEHQSRLQTIYKKLKKSGDFARKGRFVKRKASNFAQLTFSLGHMVTIPERSFLRSTFDEKNRDWYKKASALAAALITGHISAATVFGQMGNVLEGDVKAKITDGPFTPNAPATIRQKGSARPLIDTGRMRQSIRYVVRKRGSGGGGVTK